MDPVEMARRIQVLEDRVQSLQHTVEFHLRVHATEPGTTEKCPECGYLYCSCDTDPQVLFTDTEECCRGQDMTIPLEALDIRIKDTVETTTDKCIGCGRHPFLCTCSGATA